MPAGALAQPPSDAERKATLLLEDVCEAVACVTASLRPTVEPVERARKVRDAALGDSLDAVYAALGSPRDAGRALDPAPLRTVRELVFGTTPAPADPGTDGKTLGIPQAEIGHPHPYLLERSMLFPGQKGLILE